MRIIIGLITVIVTVLPLALQSQQIYLNQVKQIKGKGTEYILIKKDLENNYIAFVGLNIELNDTVDIDPGQGFYPVTSTSYQNSRKSFLCKYDSNLNLIDVKPFTGVPNSASYMGTSFDAELHPKDLIFDKNGDIVYYGGFIGTVDFDPGPDTFYVSAGFYSLFISKLDKNGNLLWVNTYNTGLEDDYIRKIEVDSFDNIIAFGSLAGSIDFDPGSGTQIHSAVGARDLFTWKLDTNGSLIWVKSIGTGYSDFGYDMSVDQSGNIYFSGSFVEDIDADPGPDTFLIQHAGDLFSFNHLIVTLDKDGNFKWANSFEDKAYAQAPVADKEGNLYLTGGISGTIDIDFGTGIKLIDTADGTGFIAKMDNSGNLLWVHQNATIGELSIDDQGDLYLYNDFKGSADVIPGPGVYNISSSNTMHYIAKLDTLLNVKWVNQFFTANDIYASLEIYRNNEYLFSGQFKHSIDFSPSSSQNSLISTGNYDGFIIKYSPNPMGIDKAKTLTNIKAYPNPTNGLIKIENEKNESLTITIYDITGKAISKKVINTSEKTELEIEGNPGIYFIEVLTEQGERQVFKIVKM